MRHKHSNFYYHSDVFHEDYIISKVNIFSYKYFKNFMIYTCSIEINHSNFYEI